MRLARQECPIWKSLGQTVEKPMGQPGITVPGEFTRAQSGETGEKKLEKEIV